MCQLCEVKRICCDKNLTLPCRAKVVALKAEFATNRPLPLHKPTLVTIPMTYGTLRQSSYEAHLLPFAPSPCLMSVPPRLRFLSRFDAPTHRDASKLCSLALQAWASHDLAATDCIRLRRHLNSRTVTRPVSLPQHLVEGFP